MCYGKCRCRESAALYSADAVSIMRRGVVMVGEGGRFVVGIVSSSMGVFSGCSSVDGLCVKERIK